MSAEVVRPLSFLLLPPSVWLGCSHSGWVFQLTQLLLGLVKGIDDPVKLCNVGVSDFEELFPELVVLDTCDIDDAEEICCCLLYTSDAADE